MDIGWPYTQGIERQSDACGAANKPPGLAALTEYCHVLMNANAFLYVD